MKKFKNKYISHERIYQFLREDKDSNGDLYNFLPQGHKKRRKKYGSSSLKRGTIVNRVSIKDRPAYIEKRNTCGHWEGDTIIGKGHKKAMITLVERIYGWTSIIKIDSKNAKLVSAKINKALSHYKSLVKSITFDNGLEFADHATIAKNLKCKIYFADPFSSYQRGTNENTNGLIRQYFPKGSDFNFYSEKDVKRAMNRLNNRPRKRLDYFTPEEKFKKEFVALNT